MPSPSRGLEEALEVVERAELGMDRRVPALGPADGPRASRIRRPSLQRIVRPFAVSPADRVNGRQVHDVETQFFDVREAPDAVGERAVPAGDRPLGAGKELVPGAPARAHAIDDDLELAVIAGAVLALLHLRDDPTERGVEQQIEAGLLAGGRIVALEREAERRRPFRRRMPRGPADQLTALQQLAHEIGLAGGRAALHLLHPGAEDIRPRLDGDGVARVALEPELPRPSIIADGAHGRLAPARLVPGAVQDHRVEEIVAFLEDVGGDLETIADRALAGIPPVVHRRLNALDQDGTNPLLLHGRGPHRQRSTR